MTHSIRRMTLALLAGAFLCGCQTMRPPRDAAGGDPDAETAEIRTAWMSQPQSGVANGQDASLPALRGRAESVAFYNPRHAASRYVAALMAYQDNDRSIAVHHLDDLLQLDPANADAAALRARIALEDGNHPYAVRMLEERIRLRPDHATLRETLASAYFVAGDKDKALAALAEAERLGAPKERVLYNRGLIQEAQGQAVHAAESYRAALAIKPYWGLPKERLKGLGLPLTVDLPKPAPVPAPAKAAAPAANPTPPKATSAAQAPKVVAPAPKAVAPAPKGGTSSATPAPKAPPAKTTVTPAPGSAVK